MKIEKKVISNLNKCYSLSEITVEGKHCFLVAASSFPKTGPNWKPFGKNRAA